MPRLGQAQHDIVRGTKKSGERERRGRRLNKLGHPRESPPMGKKGQMCYKKKAAGSRTTIW